MTRKAARAGAAAMIVFGSTVGMASAANAASRPAAYMPTWHQVASVASPLPGPVGTQWGFTAVVATGKTAGWGFALTKGGKLAAYARTGLSTWKHVKFPLADGEVVAAKATAPSDVWAFANTSGTGSEALRWNGSKWTAVHAFKGAIGAATVLSPDDVWVFGSANPVGPTNLGVWHYNGRTWTQVAKSLAGGYAVCDTNVWAFLGTTIAHYNGTSWSTANLSKLIGSQHFHGYNEGGLLSVIALAPDNVYAIGNSNVWTDKGGLVIMHYDGRNWHRALSLGSGFPNQGQVSPDGSGGLWIPVPDGSAPFLLHYFEGKHTAQGLPTGETALSIARIPGTAGQLAGAAAYPPGAATMKDVILQYS